MSYGMKFITILKVTIDSFSDLENKLKQTYMLKLWEPTSVSHDKDGISHSVCSFNNVKNLFF